MAQKLRRKIRRKVFEMMGSSRYSRPSLFEMDKKLEKYLTHKNGFFIEVGANDGFTQSNTYYYEKFQDWTGVLVEPIPHIYEKCVAERPKSQVYNCALVAEDFPDSYVTLNVNMEYAHLKSNIAKSSQESGGERDKNGNYDIKVPVRTLTSILDECNAGQIDFFSLDVEGYELNVLQGLDFTKYPPKYMLIETGQREKVEAYIGEFYDFVEQLSYHDYLYEYKL